MANEITNALLVTNGGRLSELILPGLHQQLYDPTDLRRLMVQYPFPGMGSAVSSITKLPAPPVAAAASSETSGGASNTAFTTAEAQLTLALQLVKFQVGDLMSMTGGELDVNVVVGHLMKGFGLRFTDQLCTLFTSLASSVGTTTVNLAVDDVYSGIYQLMLSNVPVEAGVACVLHNQQMVDFKESLRGETGAIQFVPSTADMLRLRSPGTQGEWNGVEFVQSDSVNTANGGADRAGAMFGVGCFGYQIGNVLRLLQSGMVSPADVLIATPEMLVERDRDHANSMASFYLKFYNALVEVEDLRGVQIVTDA